MKGNPVNMHRIFKAFVLPQLLERAKQVDALNSLLSISLYGSANYGSYESEPRPKDPESGEQDYDIWIVFKRGCQKEARRFATRLLAADFGSLPDRSICILYDKIRLQTDAGTLLLAPMIVPEESYELLQNDSSITGGDILIPWYRPRARGRPPKVPVCSKNLSWSEFDLKQTYLPDIGLWELIMPLISRQNGSVFLGTFIECALSGDCFYGDYKREDELKRKLFLDAIQHLSMEGAGIASETYKMMTLEKKSGPTFKEAMVLRFSQWLSK